MRKATGKAFSALKKLICEHAYNDQAKADAATFVLSGISKVVGAEGEVTIAKLILIDIGCGDSSLIDLFAISRERVLKGLQAKINHNASFADSVGELLKCHSKGVSDRADAAVLIIEMAVSVMSNEQLNELLGRVQLEICSGYVDGQQYLPDLLNIDRERAVEILNEGMSKEREPLRRRQSRLSLNL